MIPPVGVVLTGGASSRMGVDKALVEIGGRPMALLVADALGDGGCAPIWCQGGDAVALGRLGLDVRPDVATGRDAPGRVGPVRAIASALRAAHAPMVVVAACDLPELTGGLVRSLTDAASTTGAVAVATAGGRRHLVSAWPGTSLDPVDEAIASGVRSYGDLLAHVGALDVDVPAELVRNVNRPDDLPGESAGRRYPRPTMAVSEISVDELAPLLAAGARIVDVREPDEFVEARVPGAVLVPLATVPDHVDAFEGPGTTYVICRSGARSMRACEFLAERGLDVVNVAGGTMAWIASGRDSLAGPA